MSEYDEIVTTLRAAGCVFAEDEASLLVDAPGDLDTLDTLVARRVSGEPLEWILGWAQFGPLRVRVDPGVFVPRARTEALVDAALPLLSEDSVVVELCCGSGAISALLLHEKPGLQVYAADIDPIAVACARENLPGAQVFEGDLFDPLPSSLRGKVDVIVANTPYVPTDEVALMPPEAREYEPRHTLDGGFDGLTLLRRIAAESPAWLKPAGALFIEISESQIDAATTAYSEAGLRTWHLTDEETGTTVAFGLGV